jgi:hypothetical protein
MLLKSNFFCESEMWKDKKHSSTYFKYNQGFCYIFFKICSRAFPLDLSWSRYRENCWWMYKK